MCFVADKHYITLICLPRLILLLLQGYIQNRYSDIPLEWLKGNWMQLKVDAYSSDYNFSIPIEDGKYYQAISNWTSEYFILYIILSCVLKTTSCQNLRDMRIFWVIVIAVTFLYVYKKCNALLNCNHNDSVHRIYYANDIT